MNLDHGELDRAIGDLLDRYKAGTLEKGTAINEVAHAIQAAAQGSEIEFLAFIRSHKGANDG